MIENTIELTMGPRIAAFMRSPPFMGRLFVEMAGGRCAACRVRDCRGEWHVAAHVGECEIGQCEPAEGNVEHRSQFHVALFIRTNRGRSRFPTSAVVRKS